MEPPTPDHKEYSLKDQEVQQPSPLVRVRKYLHVVSVGLLKYIVEYGYKVCRDALHIL